jgi:hypothetical protein
MSTKIKKKPSKSARIAAKILEDSILLESSRRSNSPTSHGNLNSSVSIPKEMNAAKKPRPDKKRG